jgi:hypothetical protein
MLLKKIKFIGLVLFTMLFFSCDEKQFFSEYKELDKFNKKSSEENPNTLRSKLKNLKDFKQKVTILLY